MKTLKPVDKEYRSYVTLVNDSGYAGPGISSVWADRDEFCLDAGGFEFPSEYGGHHFYPMRRIAEIHWEMRDKVAAS